jgi:hypothetical protein
MNHGRSLTGPNTFLVGQKLCTDNGPPPRCDTGWILMCALESRGCQTRKPNDGGSFIPVDELGSCHAPNMTGFDRLG